MSILPKCKSPTCPDREKGGAVMRLAEEREDVYVFSCERCAEVNHVASAQVVVKPRIRSAAREQARALQMERKRLIEQQREKRKVFV